MTTAEEDLKKKEIGYRADADCCYFCSNSEDTACSGDMSRDNTWCVLHRMYVDETGICKDFS